MGLSFTACSFLLKKKHSRGNYLFFKDTIGVGEKDSYRELTIDDIFEEFFLEYQEPINDSIEKKTFHCEFDKKNKGETEHYTYVYAVVKSGSYGSSGEIIDNETGEKVFEKKASQTEEKPFYVFVVVPKNGEGDSVNIQKGMLFFQNVGQYGVKMLTTDYMKEFFSHQYKITLECKTIAPSLFVDRMINKESLHRIVMTKNRQSIDDADNLSFGYGYETKTIGKFIFQQEGWGYLKEKMTDFVEGKTASFELSEEEKYSELKVVLKTGRYLRTINMANLDNLSVIEQLPDTIQMADGHANKDKLLSRFKMVANDYLSQMVLQVE